jgi:uncharacterized membrane protein HdeD (DUF308 family)
LLGGISIAVPILATVEISLLLGALFIISGIAQLIHIFKVVPTRNKIYPVFIAGLSLLAGVLVFRSPMTGAVTITLIMAFYFLAASVGRAVLAFEITGGSEKIWLALSSIVSLFLGGYLIFTLPSSSLLIPGLFLGVDLIFYGITLIALTASLRNYNYKISTDSMWTAKRLAWAKNGSQRIA